MLIINHRPSTSTTLPLITAGRLRCSRVDVSPADVAELDIGIGLVCKDERRVALGGIAGTCVSAVHPVHKVAVGVPDGEDEDRTTLESATLGVQTSETQAFEALGVAVFLGAVSWW